MPIKSSCGPQNKIRIRLLGFASDDVRFEEIVIFAVDVSFDGSKVKRASTGRNKSPHLHLETPTFDIEAMGSLLAH